MAGAADSVCDVCGQIGPRSPMVAELSLATIDDRPNAAFPGWRCLRDVLCGEVLPSAGNASDAPSSCKMGSILREPHPRNDDATYVSGPGSFLCSASVTLRSVARRRFVPCRAWSVSCRWRSLLRRCSGKAGLVRRAISLRQPAVTVGDVCWVISRSRCWFDLNVRSLHDNLSGIGIPLWGVRQPM